MILGVAGWRLGAGYLAEFLHFANPPLLSGNIPFGLIGLAGAIVTLFLSLRSKPNLLTRFYFTICGGFVAGRLSEFAFSGPAAFFLTSGAGMVALCMLAKSQIELRDGSMSEKAYDVLARLAVKAFVGIALGSVAGVVRSRYPMPESVYSSMPPAVIIPTLLATILLAWMTRWIVDEKAQWKRGRRLVWYFDTAVIGVVISLAMVLTLYHGYEPRMNILAGAFMGMFVGLIVGGVIGSLSGLLSPFSPLAGKITEKLSDKVEGLAGGSTSELQSWQQRFINVARPKYLKAVSVIGTIFLIGGMVFTAMSILRPDKEIRTHDSSRGDDEDKTIFVFGRLWKPSPPVLAGHAVPVYSFGFKTRLDGRDMTASDLSGNLAIHVNFHDSVLSAAKVKEATLAYCDFSSANLHGTDFSKSVLVNSNFSDAILDGTNFTGCSLQGANLQSRVFRNVILKQAKYDAQTKWPPGVFPLEMGAVMDRD